METENFDQYKSYINTRLEALMPVFAKAAVGDFSSDIEIPETNDKFTELYMGIQVMLDVIREQTNELQAFNKDLEARILEQTKILRDQNSLLRTILHTIGDGIMVTDVLGRSTMFNPAAERLLGLRMGEYGDTAWSQHGGLFLPDGKTPFPEHALPVTQALQGHASGGIEMFIKNKSVPYGMYVLATATPLQDDGGKLLGCVMVFRDVTAHKQLEVELKKYSAGLEEKVRARTTELEEYLDILHQEEAKEKALLESIGDGVIAADRDKNILFVNQAAEQMLGVSGDALLGKSFLESVPAQDEKGQPIPDPERPLFIATTSQKSVSRSYYYVRSDGSRFPVAVTVSPILLEGGVTGVVNTFRDITKDIEMEKAKNELVSLVSHQLRTPPTGIKWYTGMLLAEEVGPLTEDQRSYLKEIAYNNQRMIDVVNAVLNVSRLELGTFKIEPTPTDVTKLADDVLGELAVQINHKELVVERDAPPLLSMVNIDPTLVRMILQNLLFNAVKYTPEKGKIMLHLEVRGPELLLQVTDTGCGIPAEDQEKIFTKLFRAKNARFVDASGTGLGLYIVKRIVNEVGGRIRFESNEGNGTTFFVTVPIAEKPLVQS